MKIFVISRRSAVRVLAILLGAGLLLVLLGSCLRGVVSVASTSRKIPIYCVDRDDKTIAISFDAAWGNEDTQQLIDILAEYDVKTTFFVVGQWVDKYPESVKALSDAGHEIMNHSNTHPHMSQLDAAGIRAEVNACNDKIESITGVRPTLLRPPYGDYNNTLVATLEEMGIYCIQWDVDSLDWKGLSADQIASRVVKNVKSGSIVLFHNAAENTPAALPKILDELINKQGYTIVPVSQVIHPGVFEGDHEGRQHKK